MKKRKVLIVEDDFDVAEGIQDVLSENDYHVTGIARNREEFLSRLADEHPDLILMDINLDGDADGIEALKSAQDCDDLLVIYLTGISDPAVVRRATETNPSSYMVKPYRDAELLANLEMAFNRQSAEREQTKSALGQFLKTRDGSLEGLLNKFAHYLKDIRKEKNITQVKVAEELGINYRHYQNIEAGKINLRMETFLKLINYFEGK